MIPITHFISPNNRAFQLNSKEKVSLKENDIFLSMTYHLLPGAPNRRFFKVPPSAEWATIKIKSSSHIPTRTSPKRILLYAIPFVRGDLL